MKPDEVFLDDVKNRKGYTEADRFRQDTVNEHVPNHHGKEVPNDGIAYVLEHLKVLYDLYSGGAPSNPGILLMPQTITQDLIVPTGFNGLTITDGLGDGYEVEVADGSKLYHIDETELAALLNVIKVSTAMSIKDVAAPYTAELLDASYTLRFTAAGTFTLPDVADQSWEVGNTITISNRSGGNVVIAGSGSTVFSTTDLTIPDDGAVTLLMDSSDEWLVIGATVA